MSGFSRTESGSSERLTQNEPAVKSPTNPPRSADPKRSQASQFSPTYPSNRLNPTGQFSGTAQPNQLSQLAASSNPNSPHGAPKPSSGAAASSSNRSSTPSTQQQPPFKMSVSPSLSSANSNQSSAASSVNSLIDQEELANLTNYVKHFREQLSKLRRLVSGELSQRKEDEHSPFSKDSSIKDLSNKELYSKERSSSKDLSPRDFLREPSVKEAKEPPKELTSKELLEKQEMFKAQLHDKLADVLRILKLIFERFVQVQSSDLFVCSKSLIEAVKGR